MNDTPSEICCVYCNSAIGSHGCRTYHGAESGRIQAELDNLQGDFAEDGIVRTVLRDRISQERPLSPPS